MRKNVKIVFYMIIKFDIKNIVPHFKIVLVRKTIKIRNLKLMK